MKRTVVKLVLALALAFTGFTQIAAPAAAVPTVPTCGVEFCSASPFCKCQWGSDLYVCHIWLDLLYLD